MPQEASSLSRDTFDQVLVLGLPKSGKAQPIDEPVLTPYGWRPIGELKIGDLVVASDGEPTRVTAIHPQGRKPIFRVITDEGSSTRCCGEHLWFTATKAELTRGRWTFPRGTPHHERSRTRKIRGEWGDGSIKTTAQIVSTLGDGTPHGEHFLPRLSRPVHFDPSAEPMPLDPYFLGLLLGDGSFTLSSPNISYTSNDPELLEAVRRGALAQEDDVVLHTEGPHTPWVHWRGTNVRLALERLGLRGCRSETKFVPLGYLMARPEDRLQLLRGLCDTDGYACTDKDDQTDTRATQAEFSTTSPRLRDAVVFIVRSLGGRALIRSKPNPTSQVGPGLPAWSVMISFDDGTCPFLLKRKVDAWRSKTKQFRQRIVAIEPAGEAECVCIEVDVVDSLYVTSDFILTHNSTSVVSTAAKTFGPGYVINCGSKSGLEPAGRRTSKFKYDLVRDENQLDAAIKEARLGTKEGAYKWVVLDDFNLYASWLEQALEDQTRNSKGEADGRRFWREYRKRIANSLIRLFDCKAHFYCITHYMELSPEIEGQIDKSGRGIAPMFGGAARKEVPAMFKDVILLDFNKKGERVFFLNPVGVYGPACRSLDGTFEIPADVGLLHEAFAKQDKKPEKAIR